MLTLCRRLNAQERPLRQRKPVRKQMLTKKHKMARLSFCKRHAAWSAADWKRVVWSDESAFQRHRRDLRHVWRYDGSNLDEQCLAVSKKFAGGPGIMVWGACGGPNITKVLVKLPPGTITGPTYKSTLQTHLVPRLHLRSTRGRQAIFMDDGARAHTSAAVKAYLTSLPHLKKLENWPPNSPDLNPIEGLWGEIKYQLQGKLFQTEADLWNAVRTVWDGFDDAKFGRMASCMPHRIAACIKARGGHF